MSAIRLSIHVHNRKALNSVTFDRIPSAVIDNWWAVNDWKVCGKMYVWTNTRFQKVLCENQQVIFKSVYLAWLRVHPESLYTISFWQHFCFEYTKTFIKSTEFSRIFVILKQLQFSVLFLR